MASTQITNRTTRLLLAGALTASLAFAGCGSDDDQPAAEAAQAPSEGAVAAAKPSAEPAAEKQPRQEPAPAREPEPVPDDSPEPKEADEMTFEPEENAVEDPEMAAAATEAPRRNKAERKKDKSSNRLKVLEIFIASAVEDRMPVKPAVNFTTDSPYLWAWTKIENHDEPTSVTMIWKHRGVEKTRVKLNVGVSSGWRTWSRRAITRDDVGAWHVEIEDAQGHLLDTMEFWVKPSNDPKVRRL